ncbi:hypothetical protein [Sphingomonas sp.]|uniref:hypothetical protein n=1 Tax=Sphingomonas sp. TaxID=28214 RepID=UPI0025F4CAD5|nr:hypothetical protein [Sphingomonas sp.]
MELIEAPDLTFARLVGAVVEGVRERLVLVGEPDEGGDDGHVGGYPNHANRLPCEGEMSIAAARRRALAAHVRSVGAK